MRMRLLVVACGAVAVVCAFFAGVAVATLASPMSREGNLNLDAKAISKAEVAVAEAPRVSTNPAPGAALQASSTSPAPVALAAPAKPGLFWATTLYSSEDMDLRQMLQHQRRMISLVEPQCRVLVVELEAGWPGAGGRGRGSQAAALDGLVADGLAVATSANYSQYEDPLFLARFFRVGDTPASLMELRRRLGAEHEIDNHHVQAWMGILTFLDQCLQADARVELCVFLESDIFLYRSGAGLLDVVRPVFAANPRFVSLMPPSFCDRGENEQCRADKGDFSSQRYMSEGIYF